MNGKSVLRSVRQRFEASVEDDDSETDTTVTSYSTLTIQCLIFLKTSLRNRYFYALTR